MANTDIRELMPKTDARFSGKSLRKPDYEDSDVIFIESIEELPQIYASQLKVNVFCYCSQGRMEIDVSGTHYVLNPGQVFVCPSGAYVDNVLITPDFKFSVLCLTDRIIQSILSTNVDVWNRAVYVRKEHIIDSKPQQHEDLGQHFMVLANAILKAEDFPFREEMLRTMLQLILLGFCARLKEIEKNETEVNGMVPTKPTQATIQFKKFLALIREEEIKHQPVYYYAEKMCISAKYLSHICKEVTGKSANDFIQMAVVEEITYYLRSTTLSVKEISNKLGFPNISFFGKYVKSHLGASPNEYRRQLYADGK